MEKKLTPMQILRDKLQEKLDIINANDSTDVFSKSGLINAIHLINSEMLPIEREQMVDIFKDAQVLHAMKNEMRAQQYYNETFKTE